MVKGVDIKSWYPNFVARIVAKIWWYVLVKIINLAGKGEKVRVILYIKICRNVLRGLGLDKRISWKPCMEYLEYGYLGKV